MRPIVFLFSAAATGLLVYLFVWVGGSRLWFSMPSMSLEIILVNVSVTAAIYFWLSRIREAGVFINSYLLSIVMKLGFYSFLLVVLWLISAQTLTGNAVLILCCYFVFTMLEVGVLFVRVNR